MLKPLSRRLFLGSAAILTVGAKMPLIPSASAAAPAQPDPALVDDLVTANRILFDQGVVDGFGHVSVRHDKQSDRFLMARNMAPGLVTASDIMEFGMDGEPIDAQGRAVYLERFIHSEIYKVHSEVKAIVHSHSPAIIPFTVTKVPLRPVYHMGAFLGTATIPVFEIRNAGGDATDMLIRNRELGAALAHSLGNAPVVLMRGHGDVVVGDSLKQVVFRAIYTEVNARLEAEALQLGQGQVNFLNSGESAKAAETIGGQAGRAWDLWKRRIQGNH